MAAARRPKLHPRIDTLTRAVVDPFSAAAANIMVKALYDPTGRSRTIPRVRRTIVSVNLPASVDSGVDIFIPLSASVPPFVQYSYDWDKTLVSKHAGGDATQDFEDGTTARIVYGGVKIGYDGALQTRGGRFYHFVPHAATIDPDDFAAEALAVPMTIGATSASLKQAISSEEVRGGDITFVMPPRFAWQDVHVVAAPGPAVGDSFHPCDGVRLYYVGTGGPYTFEIVTGIEYYHRSDHALSSPTHNHIGGLLVHQTVNNLLTLPNSDASSVRANGGPTNMLTRIQSAIETAGGFVVAAKQATQVAREAYNTVRGLGLFTGAAEVAEAGALVAL
jgi:hypothetical protein